MVRKEFPRVTPEEVGIPSAAINRLLDNLEYGGFTEPHGLMIMRGGKVCMEGWWAPYAPGIRHGLQSHTKTYAATAVGVAYTEGIVKLDERLIDIFPEYAPAEPSENLKKLTVHHVLCMANGMKTMPRPSVNWIRDFINTPVEDEPGTSFMYNSTGSGILGAIVRKKTGLGLFDYLTPRLFDKIGIDASNLRCSKYADGMEIGGGGMYATTEDNLRLMKLYADGGVWEGERILAEDYVKLATSLQNQSATERAVNPPAEDNFVGYGYQIWMCRPEGVYRADGAMGQFTIVVPDRDMIIAITENASGSTGGVNPQKVLDHMWLFLDEIPKGEGKPIPVADVEAQRLQRRLQSLSLKKPAFAPFSPCREKINRKVYDITQGNLSLVNAGARFMSGAAAPAGITSIGFGFSGDMATICYEQEGETTEVKVALNGGYADNTLGTGVVTRALVSGAWTAENVFTVTFRWIETTSASTFTFTFDGDDLAVENPGMRFFRGMAPVPVKGKAR